MWNRKYIISRPGSDQFIFHFCIKKLHLIKETVLSGRNQPTFPKYHPYVQLTLTNKRAREQTA